jgi:uncharacterized membrane protein
MQPAFTPVILTHTFAAIAALALGIVVFMRRKGTPTHRWMGRAWVGLMALTALSSFFIKANGSFSWIHLLSIGVLLMLVLGVVAAMRRNLVSHQRIMKGVFTGGLIIAGAFTLLPHRLLGRMLWGSVGLMA